MPPTVTGLAIGFAILFVVFRALEWLRPRERRMPLRRRGFFTDLVYWVFTPHVTRTVTRVSVLIVLVPFALLVYGRVDRDLIQHGFGPVARLPLWVQAIGILV